MKVIVGEQPEEVIFVSGVLQGTVLEPLLFLCHINDYPDAIKTSVPLFADDYLLYRPIKTQKDHNILLEDLKKLEVWANNLRMRFNAKKCYSINKSAHTELSHLLY